MSNGKSNVRSVEGKIFSEIKNNCPCVVKRITYISSVFSAKEGIKMDNKNNPKINLFIPIRIYESYSN
jgi:hypothetical protein